MPETRLAHFTHHWQAEMARGYLDDAGIAARLVSDNLGGGIPYLGSLAGAWVLVATERADEAHAVLAAAGLVSAEGAAEGEGAGSASLDAALAALTPARRADREDLERALRQARRAELRHGVFCVLGVTPAAAIPLVGLALEGNVALMALLCVLVVLVEGWRWMAAGRRARQIEVALAGLDDDADVAP